MVTSENGTDGVGALTVSLVGSQVIFIHCIKDTAVNGLESVTHVGQCTGNDNRH